MTSVRLPDVCAMVYQPWFSTTDNDLTCTIKEQEKCVLRRLSRRKCHLLVAENIWLRQEKVTWKKLILHLRGWCCACKDFFFHYVDRNCEKRLKPGKQSCSNDNWRWHEWKTKIEEIARRTESIKTEAEAEITSKNSDQEVKLRDNI